jgi:hypothetical protein
VGAQLQKGSSAWGGGREKRDVGASTAGHASGRLGRWRGLTGGVRDQRERASKRVVSADGEGSKGQREKAGA